MRVEQQEEKREWWSRKGWNTLLLDDVNNCLTKIHTEYTRSFVDVKWPMCCLFVVWSSTQMSLWIMFQESISHSKIDIGKFHSPETKVFKCQCKWRRAPLLPNTRREMKWNEWNRSEERRKNEDNFQVCQFSLWKRGERENEIGQWQHRHTQETLKGKRKLSYIAEPKRKTILNRPEPNMTRQV